MILRLLEFWTYDYIDIEPAGPSRSVTRKARRIERRAGRLARKGWLDARGRHHRWERDTAVMFAFWHVTNLAPRPTENGFDFIHLGGGAHPAGTKLSEWATAYASVA